MLLLLIDNINSYSHISKLSEIFKAMINYHNTEYFSIIKSVKITTIERYTLKTALILIALKYK